MSRKVTYNINRFDGGITDDIRNVNDLSRCAHISHFDIYRDAYVAYPLPGYVDDMNDGSTEDGMQQYSVKAFFYNGTLYAVGTKSNGTGSKLFSKATAETASWSAVSSGEGTDDLSDNTFLHVVGSRTYFVTEAGGSTYLAYYAGSVTDKAATLETFTQTKPLISEYAFNDTVYINTLGDDVLSLGSSSVTDPAKDTSIRVSDVQSGDEQLGIFGHRFFPYRAQLLLWDSASTLADRKVEFGKGRAAVIGYPAGVWVGVMDENLDGTNAIFNEEANGTYSMSVKYASVGGAKELVRLYGATNTNGRIKPLRAHYEGAMLFYARIPTDATPTTYKEGIWAVGQAKDGSPLALSLLFDMGTLGSLEGYYNFGHHHYFAHNGDGSISRLDTPDGTYDIVAEYHSLMFGADSPYQKSLNGITVVTGDVSGTVQVYYRTADDASWTSMGSSTSGQQHTFTRASGSPIGKFHEIQFKIEVTGNIPLKNVHVSLTEEDDLAYSA